MKDRIDQRDFLHSMHSSVIKYWNVNFEPEEEETRELPEAEQEVHYNEVTGKAEPPSALYGQKKDEMEAEALAIYERLQNEAAADEAAKEKEIADLLAQNNEEEIHYNEVTGKAEPPSALYGQKRDEMEADALAIYERLQNEAAADEAAKEKEIADLIAAGAQQEEVPDEVAKEEALFMDMPEAEEIQE
ncbi:hypothetical protein [Eubacterium oxidoreducens]|uniref:Uncharacterized protein n=1 Tax=Eubacterium oxidoreducens TaxID=1732 RepID=A0A1G6AX12_EUBOX|nr:hypothetical protein [Eubacterium oxidoreducens]SDB12922.1 hypothetical protein SAMN02910417_00987 [Eubacterium oxidoreducens]